MCDPLGVPRFHTKDDVFDWIYHRIGDDNIDNARFAFKDDAEAVSKYRDQESVGCCGSFDEDVIVAGRAAMIGCNYGH